MKHRPVFFLGISLYLLAAVAAYPQTQTERKQQPPSSEAAADSEMKFTKIDVELLAKVKQFDRYLEEKGYLYADPELNAYVRRVGESVLPQETPANVEWRFRIVRDPMPNAFALPNGSIYVHTGLLALLENEAQLASVLAHEARHVTGRHSYKENRSQRKKMVAIDILFAASQVAGSAGGWGAVAGAVISIIPNMVVATIYGYSRELEREADVKAFTALNQAGYSTEEMPITFKLLRDGHEVELADEPAFYRSHPRLEERITYLNEMVNTIRPTVRHPKVEAEAYALAVEKVTRHNLYLDIQSGRARTALFAAKVRVKHDPQSSDNYVVLGDAYRALGPRAPEPTEEELSSKGKSETRKMLSKMTLDEYENALMQKPGATATWEENRKLAEEAYRKALELDSGNSRAYRGLGFLYERDKHNAEAAIAFRKYLELEPNATDRMQIQRRLESVEKQIAATPGTGS